MKNVLLIVTALFLSGCVAPYSSLYSPADPQEAIAFKNSDRKVFPNDVRKNIDEYLSTEVAWTGVLKRVKVLSNSPKEIVKFTIEHHYWDWIEDHSIQKAVAFLSPRGEGMFSCIKSSRTQNTPIPPIGSMAIVYGYPIHVDPKSGEIVLKCKGISFTSKSWYSMKIWDYGRNYLLNGDKSDFKVLKVPLI